MIMKLKRWRATAVILTVGSCFLAGCAPVSNPALERARSAYERVRRDPGVAGRAGVALDKTRLTLEQAERVWADDKDATEVEHLAYLTEKRAEIALATAKRRLAADEIQQLKPQRD
jgi:hypothetical protein